MLDKNEDQGRASFGVGDLVAGQLPHAHRFGLFGPQSLFFFQLGDDLLLAQAQDPAEEPFGLERLQEALAPTQLEIVDEAEDGEQAIGKIVELKPDLVFLDIQMPKLDGFDVLELLGDEAEACRTLDRGSGLLTRGENLIPLALAAAAGLFAPAFTLAAPLTLAATLTLAACTMWLLMNS